MNLRLLLLLALGILFVVAAMAAACGDDDGGGNGGGDGQGAQLSVEDYLREVDEIQDGVTQATDTIGARSEQAFADPTAARQALSAAVSVGEGAVTALNELDPSVGAEPAHERLTAAGEKLVTAVQGYVDRLEGVEPGPEFEEIKADAEDPDSDLSVAINEMIEACELMQLFVDDALQDFELSCPEPPA